MSDQPQAGAPSTFPWPLAAPTASNSGSTIAPHFVSEMSQREYDDEEILAENIAYGRLRGQEQREHHTSRSTYSTADDVQLITRNRLSDPIIVQGAGMPPRQSWESGMSNGSSLLPPRQSRSRAGLSPSPAETLASYAYSCPEERAERNSSVSTSPMAPLAGPGREQRSGSVMGCEWTESAVPVDMRYPTPIDEGAGRQQNALQLDLGSRDSVQQEYEADDERRNSSADPGWSSRASSSSMEEDESAGRVAGSYWTKGLTPARHLSGTSTLEQGPSEHGSCEAALSAIFEPVDWVGVAAHGGPRGSLGVADSPARFADALDGAASAPRSSVTSSVSVALDDDRVMWSPLAQQGYQGSTLAYRAASTTSSLRSSMRAAQRWAQTYDIDGERQADRTSNAAL